MLLSLSFEHLAIGDMSWADAWRVGGWVFYVISLHPLSAPRLTFISPRDLENMIMVSADTMDDYLNELVDMAPQLNAEQVSKLRAIFSDCRDSTNDLVSLPECA